MTRASILTLDNLYMSVPYEDKEWAKKQGMKFDGNGKCWYLPPGKDPLPLRRYWSYLENTYEDRKQLKRRGCRYNGNLKKWYVPADRDFDKFTKWWPDTLRQFLFDDKYAAHQFIARSGQAEVYRGYHVSNDEEYAIKYFVDDLSNISEKTKKKSFSVEHKALLQLDEHQNIVKMHTWGKKDDRYFVVTEWINGGNCNDYIGNTPEEGVRLMFDRSGVDLSEEEWKETLDDITTGQTDLWLDEYPLILGILDALVHAHSRGIYHRDVKPGNILLELDFSRAEKGLDPFVPKLCDFGASKIIGTGKNKKSIAPTRHTLVNIRTEPYRPNYDESTEKGKKEIRHQDTWDLLAWAVLTVEFLVNQHLDTLEEVRSHLEEKIAVEVDREIVDLLRKALSDDPEERPQDTKKFRSRIVKLTEKRKKRLKWKD